jgi:four helix bundle protein
MAFETFEDLKIWQEARKLTVEMYAITKRPSFSKDFEMINQMRRGLISITSNIAEGFERGSNREFIYFLTIAKGSSGEVRSHVYLALDQGYIDNQECEQLVINLKKLSSMLSNFLKHLKDSQYKGPKFKKPIT